MVQKSRWHITKGSIRADRDDGNNFRGKKPANLKPKKIVAVAILTMVLLFGLSAAAQAKKITLKISLVVRDKEPVTLAAVDFGKEVEKLTNGEIKVQVFPNGELGTSRDNAEQVQRGSNIVVWCSPAVLGEYVPDYAIFDGPFLFKNYEDLRKVVESDWHQSVMESASQKGLKILDMGWYFGARSVISGKSLTTQSDFKGLKIRIPRVKMWLETFNALASSPTTISFSEVYSALSQGVAEAAEAPLSSLFGMKFYEIKKNIALTRHFTSTTGLVMSQKLFDSLTPEQQKVLVATAKKYGAIASENTIKSESEFQKKLEENGVRFNEVDRDAFVNATRKVYDAFPEWTPGLYEKVQKILSQ